MQHLFVTFMYLIFRWSFPNSFVNSIFISQKSIAWNDIFIIAGSLHLAGVVYYAVFASGQRQPWADGHKITATMDADTGQIQYDELNSEDEGSEQDQLLRQSLPTGFYDAKDDEFGSSMRFLNSI